MRDYTDQFAEAQHALSQARWARSHLQPDRELYLLGVAAALAWSLEAHDVRPTVYRKHLADALITL